MSRLAVGPHVVLATAVLLTLGLEALRGRATVGFSIVWPVAQAAVAGCALLFAWRRQKRWLLSGVALGLGAAVKWTPALSLAALVLWLIRSRGGRTAGAHLGGAVCAFLVVNVPFLVWSPHQVFAAYRLQGSRGITGESLPFIPLKLLGFARSSNEFWNAAAVPNHANGVAIAVQAVVVLASFIVVATRGRNLAAAVATAAMVPVVFLLFNRIFSPQFLVPLAAAWAVAGSLLARNRRDQLVLGILICGATLANTLVYPTRPSAWLLFSGTLFVLSLLATGFVYVMARASHAGGPQSDPRCAHS